MTILYLIRHGHTVWHDTGGVAGRTDIGLSDAGRAAVAALRDTISQTFHPALHVSSLQRTRDTAAILFADRDDAIVDDRLVELDFGAWEGSTWDAVHRDHGDALAAWGDDWVNRAPPHGESFGQQIARCQAWLDDALRARDDAIVAVTHGGSIRALLTVLLDVPADHAMQFTIDPARLYRLERHGAGWRCTHRNADRFD